MNDVSSRITVSAITAQDEVGPFGLARLAFPDLTVARWRRLLKRWTGDGRGMAGALVARDSAGRIVGFAPYEVRSDLSPGRILWVERVVAVSLVDSGPALRALAEALVEQAARLGCKRLKIETCSADRVLREALVRGGAVRSVVLQATI